MSPHDRWLQTILNNVVYYLNEAPDPTQNESDYCLPCEDDKATLLLRLLKIVNSEFSDTVVL